MNNKPLVTAHMIVKNDDQWVWYAIESVLPFVDRFIITDTGSTDKTVEYIQLINSPKIEFDTYPVANAREVVKVREEQLNRTPGGWLWMVDGDEVYSQSLCKEIIQNLHSKYSGVVVRRYDCLGDIFHYQPDETVGGYHMFGTTAHYSLRLINLSVPGLTFKGEYPNEGFYDEHTKPLLDYPQEKFYITTKRYLHTTYLKRSSLGGNLANTLHRMKYKVELGKKTTEIPEVLRLTTPPGVPKPQKRSIAYELEAAVMTPLKVLKRKLNP